MPKFFQFHTWQDLKQDILKCFSLVVKVFQFGGFFTLRLLDPVFRLTHWPIDPLKRKHLMLFLDLTHFCSLPLKRKKHLMIMKSEKSNKRDSEVSPSRPEFKRAEYSDQGSRNRVANWLRILMALKKELDLEDWKIHDCWLVSCTSLNKRDIQIQIHLGFTVCLEIFFRVIWKVQDKTLAQIGQPSSANKTRSTLSRKLRAANVRSRFCQKKLSGKSGWIHKWFTNAGIANKFIGIFNVGLPSCPSTPPPPKK